MGLYQKHATRQCQGRGHGRHVEVRHAEGNGHPAEGEGEDLHEDPTTEGGNVEDEGLGYTCTCTRLHRGWQATRSG